MQNIDLDDEEIIIFHTCYLAIEDSIQTYRDSYLKSTRTYAQSRYPKILCACGYANLEEDGIFRATEVLETVKAIFKDSTITIQSVVPALGEFCKPERGSVLSKVSFKGRNQYKFTDPMMRPFLKMKAVTLLKSHEKTK